MPAAIAWDLALGAAAAAAAASVGWTAYLVSLLLLPDARVSVRWCGAGVVALWYPVALFWLLTPWRGFRLPVVLVLVTAVAALLHVTLARRSGATVRLRRDARAAAALVATLGRPERWLGGALLAVVAIRTLRAVASPPLAWDDLTYHLVKAGRWVQAGGFLEAPAPDAWGAYGYLPVVGEVLWSWALLLTRSDAAVAVASLLVWCLAPLAVYAGARELGASPRASVLAALGAGGMPALVSYVGSGYVDNVTAASAGLGCVFALRLLGDGRAAEAPLAMAGLALAAGTKVLALPLLALGLAAVVLALLRGSAPAGRWAAVLAVALAASAVALPTYARAWLERGSPLYPFAVEIGGVTVSRGNPESAEIAREVLEDPASRVSSLDSLRFLLGRPNPSGAFLNPGLAAPVVLLLALVALRRLGRRRLLPGLLPAASAAVFLGAYLSGAMELFRTTQMVATTGRYLTPAFVALGMLAARCEGRIPRLLWGVAVGWNVAFSLPLGWSAAGVRATAWIALGLAVLAAVVAAAELVRRGPVRGRRLLGAALLATVVPAGVGAGLAGVRAVRETFGPAIREAAADVVDPAFQVHPLDPHYASAWPLWQALDGPPTRLVAVTAGFEGLGHNWYVYPLLGSRLQNRVLYVPVTRSGEVVDYRGGAEVRRRADRGCWLARLSAAGVDAVASLAPRTTIEEEWMRASPELFEPIVVTRDGRHALYGVDRSALEEIAGGACAPAAPTS